MSHSNLKISSSSFVQEIQLALLSYLLVQVFSVFIFLLLNLSVSTLWEIENFLYSVSFFIENFFVLVSTTGVSPNQQFQKHFQYPI